MTPFHRARNAAKQLRTALFGELSSTPLVSTHIVEAVAHEDAEDFEISPAHPADKALGGADAVLLRKLRLIIIRNDVPIEERSFLIAHEFGHWKLHPEEHDSCHRVIDSTLKPDDADTFGSQKVEAYGARERAELQANIFARELLLPRELARYLFLAGWTATRIQQTLCLPLELVRQQLLDGLLLPDHGPVAEKTLEAITPTNEQTKAATSQAKTSLVVAGPGTGKTATLLMRVKHLLEQGAKPSELLLLTFSNRAARELVERLQLAGVENAHEIWVGTFHAFGLEFLRKNHEHFGLRAGFGVADKMAQIALIEPYIYGLDLTAFNPLGDPLDWLNQVVITIQRAKDELADANAFAQAVETSASQGDSFASDKQRDIVKLYRCYEERLRADGGLVDMGDLVMLPALALCQDHAKFLASVGRFKHVLVDEYQDVNRASARLVQALAKHAQSLWIVGDARQAIYRFRGASMRNILEFGEDFPDHKTFPLNENRRSYAEVVKVFEHTGRNDNPLQMVLPLDDVSPVRGASGVRPRHIQCANNDIVRGELASNVRRLHAQGVPYRNQVILASMHDTCGDAADALNAAGVPALHLGDIFQRPEIKDLLAMLQLFVDRSGSGLVRAARLPGLELPPNDLEFLIGWLKTHRPDAMSWLQASPEGLSTQGKAAVQQWVRVFQGLSSGGSPWDVVCVLLFDRTDILRPHVAGDTIRDITRRLALWQFVYYLRAPDGNRTYQTVGSFITRLRRRLRVGDDRELRMPPPEADGLDAVAVMTIHQSKGLEFEAVHLVDVDAWHFRVLDDSDLVPRSLLSSVVPKDNFEAETEASNKLYVALSRAKKHLILYETRARYNAVCVDAVLKASHLLDRVTGSVVLPKALPPPGAVQPQSVDAFDFGGFLTYRACPRRYYYDVVRGLSPTAGLHPAALVEGAVTRELFVPHGTDPGAPPKEVERVLASFGSELRQSLPYLKAYADQLLASGRSWLGMPRAVMAKPFEVTCAGLPLIVSPHRIGKSGPTITIEFVRTNPPGKVSAQRTALKWVLKYLGETHRQYSFIGSLYSLSNGATETVSPYGRLPDDFVLVPVANGLKAGDFQARPTPWACPKCRHFMYCPA